MSEDVSTVDYAQAAIDFGVTGVAVGISFVHRPRTVGYYTLGNSDLGHFFYLTRKPGRIERFFVHHLLGLTWVDAC